MNSLILVLPGTTVCYTVDTDACIKLTGFVLLQERPEGPTRLIGYWSTLLSEKKTDLTTTHRECLAVVWAVLMLRSYFKGSPFTVRTEHKALQWLLTASNAPGNLARWTLRLSEFALNMVLCVSIKCQAAGAMQRLSTDGKDKKKGENRIPVLKTDKHVHRRQNWTRLRSLGELQRTD